MEIYGPLRSTIVSEIKINISTKDGSEINLSVNTVGLSTEHLNAVLNVIKQVNLTPPAPVSSNSYENIADCSVVNHETQDPFNDKVSEIIGTTPDIWFNIASWAKRTDSLLPKQRGIAFSIGRILSEGGIPTVKQCYAAKRIMSEAHRLGFKYSCWYPTDVHSESAYSESKESGDVSTTEAQAVIEKIKRHGSDDNKNRKFTLNYRLHKLTEDDRDRLVINRNVIVNMLRSLISHDFDYYCKYIKKQERLDKKNVGMYWCTSKEWSQIFKRFSIIDSSVDEKEVDRLSKIVLKLLVSRQYSLETECPDEQGNKSLKKVVAMLRKCKNTENKTVYVFAIRESN